MRVLYLNHVSQMSGAEHSLLTLATGVRERGVEVEVALPGSGPFADHLREAGMAVSELPFCRLTRPRGLGQAYTAWRKLTVGARALRRHLSRAPADIVHANSTTAHLFATYAQAGAKTPLVWQVRDLTPLGRLTKWLSRRATAIIAISRAVAEHLEAEGADPGRVRVIAPGIAPPPTTGARDRLRSGWGFEQGDFLFGMVSQLVPWKRPLDFVLAARRLCDQQRDLKFILVGADLFGDHPELVAKLTEQAGALPPGRFVREGYRRDIGDVLTAMDCLVLPSDGEPFGRVLVEAMLLGKPVIATAAGGPTEIVLPDETGWLVPVAQPAALAAAMREAAADRQRGAAFGQAGRRRAEALFSVERNVTQTVDLYRALLSSKSDRPQQVDS